MIRSAHQVHAWIALVLWSVQVTLAWTIPTMEFVARHIHSFASADPFILSLGVLDVRTIGLGSFDSFETTSPIHLPHTMHKKTFKIDKISKQQAIFVNKENEDIVSNTEIIT